MTANPSMLPWETLEALKGYYQQIRMANGYLTNIGERATTEPHTQNEVNALPDLSITAKPNFGPAPGSDEPKKNGTTFRSWGMDIFLESNIPIDNVDARKTAWMVHADLVEATKKPGTITLPNGAHHLSIQSGDIIEAPAGQPFITVQLVLYVGLVTN